MHRVTLLVFGLVISGTMAQFNPTMTIDSCSRRSLLLTLEGASDTGIVYVQGVGAACKQPTSSGTTQHTIAFTACGISLDSTFMVVIQKKATYGTGEDKHIPVTCVADLSSDTVGNSLVIALSGDADDNTGKNMTVKPTAAMTLYRDGVDVSGGTVKLTDSITMIVELDADYIDDFDIKARECSASTITITQSYCANDPDLFPQFTKVGQGEISVTFGAFRTTDLNGGSVIMPFTCTIQVCLGACPENDFLCSDGSTGHGRKRRYVNKAGDSGMDDFTVGASISVAIEEVVLEDPETEADLCMDQTLFIAIVTTLVGGTVVSSAASNVMFKKLQARNALLQVARAAAGQHGAKTRGH